MIDSDVDDFNVTPDTRNLAPNGMYSNESQASVQYRDEQPLENFISSTAGQETTTQIAFDDDAETITEEENVQEKEARTVNTGPTINKHAVLYQKANAAPTKLEDEETAHTTKDTASGKWLTRHNREYARSIRESAKSDSSMVTLSPARCQNLLARIRDAEVSSLDLNKSVRTRQLI